MKKQLVIDEMADKRMVCVLEDGELVEVLSSSADSRQICGNIYLGKVENVLASLNAAFIDIGQERNAILSDVKELERSNALKPIRNGSEIAVQVTKLPGGEKGAVVSANIKLTGAMCVLMPYSDSVAVSKRVDDDEQAERLKQIAFKYKPQGMGLIMRTDAKDESEDAIARDISDLKRKWDEIKTKSEHVKAPLELYSESDVLYKAARDVLNEDVDEVIISSQDIYNEFTERVSELKPRLIDRVKLKETDNLFAVYKINSALEKAKQRKLWLDCGGFIVIDKTEAMTVIDVNSGKAIAGKDAEKNILKVNLEAAREIMKQMRLRDTGGIIIVDFIDMQFKSAKETLLNELRSLALRDKNRTKVIDITSLGLAELTRKKKNEGING